MDNNARVAIFPDLAAAGSASIKNCVSNFLIASAENRRAKSQIAIVFRTQDELC